jgi:hypothetical protein
VQLAARQRRAARGDPLDQAAGRLAAGQQPLDLVTWLIEGMSLCLEAAAQAEDVNDLFGRLEACGQLVRLDPAVEPT